MEVDPSVVGLIETGQVSIIRNGRDNNCVLRSGDQDYSLNLLKFGNSLISMGRSDQGYDQIDCICSELVVTQPIKRVVQNEPIFEEEIDESAKSDNIREFVRLIEEY